MGMSGITASSVRRSAIGQDELQQPTQVPQGTSLPAAPRSEAVIARIHSTKSPAGITG
jgi:hypothetical protein